MARLDVFKPWGARDRWMAVKIQRFYRMIMARKEYLLLKSVLGIQGQYREPFTRLIQRVWRGVKGRRHFFKIKQYKYPFIIKIQTRWRMYVASERVKFRKLIRNKWQARNIQRIFRGHWVRQLVRRKKFLIQAIDRWKTDPSCIWGLVQVAMRLNTVSCCSLDVSCHSFFH
jgi:hypothetical protein